MIDDDILALVRRDGTADLTALESDIRRRQESLRAARGASRRLASLQALVVAVAIAASAVAGMAAAVRAANERPSDTFTAAARLAPSSLLFGAAR